MVQKIMLQKNYISNKCCYFELSIHQKVLEKKYITVSTKKLHTKKKQTVLH